jgi:hypothetical protein
MRLVDFGESLVWNDSPRGLIVIGLMCIFPDGISMRPAIAMPETSLLQQEETTQVFCLPVKHCSHSRVAQVIGR